MPTLDEKISQQRARKTANMQAARDRADRWHDEQEEIDREHDRQRALLQEAIDTLNREMAGTLEAGMVDAGSANGLAVALIVNGMPYTPLHMHKTATDAMTATLKALTQ